MSKLNELIIELNNSQSVIKYKNLEKIINSNKNISSKYHKLLELQKVLVQSENSVLLDNDKAQANYNELLLELMDNPVISEYLRALEEVNEDLNMIQTIIENEINNEIK